MLKLIIFDLDGTLTESKGFLDGEMGTLLGALLAWVPVAVISGGDWPQFQSQLLSKFPETLHLAALTLMPTCGTKLYRYSDTWRKIYSEDFTPAQSARIRACLQEAVRTAGFEAEQRWGDTIEDRGSQITFSGLGQQAPLDAKQRWDPQFAKRVAIKRLLDRALPEFAVHLGGMTSIDITTAGVDKAYGVGKLRDALGVSYREMLFVGDMLFPGGNDFPVQQAGVTSIGIRDPHETKRVIETLLACLEKERR